MPGEPVDVARAVAIALANNPDAAMATERIRRSAAMTAQARAAFMPMVSVYGEYVQGNAPSGYLFKTMDQRLLAPQVNFNDPGWFENWEAGASARVNLFSGGSQWLGYRMARKGEAAARLSRGEVRNTLSATVVEAFYNVLAAGEARDIARQSRDTVDRQLSIMRVRFEGGGALKSDILSLEVREAQAKEDLVRAENSRSLALAALANLLGFSPDTDLVLNQDEPMATDFPEGYEAGLPLALAKRPELAAARLAVERSAMAVDAARAAYLPRVDGQAKVYVDDPNADFNWDRRNWTVGAVVNWELWAGGVRSARVEEARAVLAEMLAGDEKATQGVMLDVKSAYLNLGAARARCPVTRASVAQAEESLRLVKTQYEGGSATVSRYLDAELAAHRARMAAANAFYDRMKARADLARALGLFAPDTEGGLPHE